MYLTKKCAFKGKALRESDHSSTEVTLPLGPGPSGCRFNSCRAHHFPEPIYMGSGDLLRRFIAMKLMNSNLICSSRSIAHTANVTCHFSGGLPLI